LFVAASFLVLPFRADALFNGFFFFVM
jgi:hypothetical protein